MDKNRVAPTPPMGWNSWDCYGASVTEDILLGNAAYMAEHLKEFGWEYVVCDIQWSEPTAESCDYHPFADLCMDEYSRLIPAPNRFPSSAGGKGFAPIAEKIHAMGLKFGIHILRGIPRQAVHRNTPVKGTDVGARSLAQAWSLCRWNTDMYGINPEAKDAQCYYDSIFELYASWGVDYVKVDDICNTNTGAHAPYSAKAEIEMIRRAIDRCGREMVLSLSPGPAQIEQAWHLCKYANLWRITDDFWDAWPLLKAMFERCDVWQAHVKPGCWPDCDMLPLGVLRCFRDGGEWTRFTRDEQRTLMNLWCMFRSPLMMGGDMRRNDDWTLSLLTNAELLRLTHSPTPAVQLQRSGDEAAWTNRDADGRRCVALFNLSDEMRTVRVSLDEVGMARAKLYDLWAHAATGEAVGEIAVELAPHASAAYRLEAIGSEAD